MQQLIGIAKPRYSRDDFRDYLKVCVANSKRVKRTVTSIYDMLQDGMPLPEVANSEGFVVKTRS